jgi:hypothetical protein
MRPCQFIISEKAKDTPRVSDIEATQGHEEKLRQERMALIIVDGNDE